MTKELIKAIQEAVAGAVKQVAETRALFTGSALAMSIDNLKVQEDLTNNITAAVVATIELQERAA